jgi:hypothetical protein
LTNSREQKKLLYKDQTLQVVFDARIDFL